MRRFSLQKASACQNCKLDSLRHAPKRLAHPFLVPTYSRRWYAQSSKSASTLNPKHESRSPQEFPSSTQIQEPGSLLTTQDDLVAATKRLAATRDGILSDPSIPEEKHVVEALIACKVVAESACRMINKKESERHEVADSAVSRLLSLEDKGSSSSASSIWRFASIEIAKKTISELAYSLVKHSTVFISPTILEQYVLVQAQLGRPDLIPEIFQLYANKPLPRMNGSKIVYKKQNPNLPAAAIPTEISERALQSAIDTRRLTTAADIIDICYTTTAFKRAKFMQKALLPTIGVASLPFISYGLALKYAAWQASNSPIVATNIAFIGFLAYFGFTGMLGYVALTTANDQMRRVTWVEGTPLHERWFREDERAAIDKLACQLGYKEKERWGEEQGKDWEALREWIGIKGMWLDRISLMEGMQ